MKINLVILITGFVVLLVSGGSRFAIGLTLNPMASEFDWDRGTISLAVLAFLIVSSVWMFLAGRLADRFGLTHILASGLFISALGIGLITVAPSPWLVFLLYGFVFAIGNGLTSITPVGVLISRWFSGRIGLANATAISGMGVGQLIMIAILASVMVTSGWRPVYFWLGVVNLLLIPFVLLAIRTRLGDRGQTPNPAPNDVTGIAFKEARRTPYFRRLTIVYMICGFQDFFVATHVVAFAQDRGVDTLFAGNLLALMGLTGFIGALVAGAWSDQSNPLRPTIGCFVLRIVIFALIMTSQTTTIIAIFALAYGITFWATAPLTVVFARSAFGPSHLGSITGFVTMAHHMAGGIGAYIGGLLFDVFGHYHFAFALMFCLSVAGVVLSVPLRRPVEVTS